MKKKILVLGAGQGGMVAAIKLAEAGYDVTVLEAAKEPEVGYPWYDDIRHDIFDLVEIPEPPREDYTQKSKWIFRRGRTTPRRANGSSGPRTTRAI